LSSTAASARHCPRLTTLTSPAPTVAATAATHAVQTTHRAGAGSPHAKSAAIPAAAPAAATTPAVPSALKADSALILRSTRPSALSIGRGNADRPLALPLAETWAIGGPPAALPFPGRRGIRSSDAPPGYASRVKGEA